MKRIPNEIINYIYSFLQPHPVSIILGKIIQNGYLLDFDPFLSLGTLKNYYHESCSFCIWYFKIIRKYRQMNSPRYVLTPPILLLGNDYYWYWITNDTPRFLKTEI